MMMKITKYIDPAKTRATKGKPTLSTFWFDMHRYYLCEMDHDPDHIFFIRTYEDYVMRTILSMKGEKDIAEEKAEPTACFFGCPLFTEKDVRGNISVCKMHKEEYFMHVMSDTLSMKDMFSEDKQLAKSVPVNDYLTRFITKSYTVKKNTSGTIRGHMHDTVVWDDLYLCNFNVSTSSYQCQSKGRALRERKGKA